jgi:cell division protein FtsW (lipid II flippase)
MKKLKISATFTAILGFFLVLALIFLYLALSDIARQEEDLILEWHVAGVCMIILSIFVVSAFVTLGFLIKKDRIWNNSR